MPRRFCLQVVGVWMKKNRLQLNLSKTASGFRASGSGNFPYVVKAEFYLPDITSAQFRDAPGLMASS